MKDMLSNFWENNRQTLTPDKIFLEKLSAWVDCIKNRINEVAFCVDNIDNDATNNPIFEKKVLEYLSQLDQYNGEFIRIWKIRDGWKHYVVEIWIRRNEKEANSDFVYYDITKINIPKEKLSEIK